MSTILDILGSSIIAGLLILAMLSLLFNLTDVNFVFARYLDMQQRVNIISEIMKTDFNMAGIGVPDSLYTILSAGDNSIVFLTNSDFNSVLDTVSYSLVKTVNVDGDTSDVLKRYFSADVSGAHDFHEVSLSFKYFDKDQAQTASLSSIRSVEASLYHRDKYDMKDERASGYLQWQINLKNLRK